MSQIYRKTRLNVADNTGILIVECIAPKGGKRACGPGEIIKVCVKKATPEGRKHWKGTHDALVVRTVGKFASGAQDVVSFSDNAVVMLNPSGDPIGTRVFGPISRKVENRKILSMAKVVV